LCICRWASAAAPDISAASAILVDAATGRILYEKNAHEKRPIASTTKILTALLALEKCSPEEMVRVGKASTLVEGSRLGLEEGEEIALDALLKALLLKSANDAAVALAEHMGGDVDGFSSLMNLRAFELGARESHFRNPHGLHQPDHYSSAYDLALIGREAMKNPFFRELVSTRACSLDRPDGTDVQLLNHNRLLFKDDSVDGIKTGYVRESGHCLVISASRDGWRLIGVLLDSQDLWKDAAALLEYGFSNWEATVFASTEEFLLSAPVFGAKKERVPVVGARDLVEIRRSGEKSLITREVEIKRLFAPVRKGQEVGRLLLFERGRQVGSTKLLAAENLEEAFWFGLLHLAGKGILAVVIAVTGLKVYGKAAKIARRRRHRLPPES
jgi:D-alanyl-D-alanine carboxypeptidase (penicillin-binding protein 5/6)